MLMNSNVEVSISVRHFESHHGRGPADECIAHIKQAAKREDAKGKLDADRGVDTVQVLANLANQIAHIQALILPPPTRVTEQFTAFICGQIYTFKEGTKKFLDFEFKGNGVVYCKLISGDQQEVIVQRMIAKPKPAKK